jgi:hypothetical protein
MPVFPFTYCAKERKAQGFPLSRQAGEGTASGSANRKYDDIHAVALPGKASDAAVRRPSAILTIFVDPDRRSYHEKSAFSGFMLYWQ